MKIKKQQKNTAKKSSKFIKNFNFRNRVTLSIFLLVSIILIALQTTKIIDAKEVLQFNQNPKNYNVKLQIIDNNKIITEFLVAVANDDHKKMYGLMNLDKLPQNHGMLFNFFTKRVITMWMKNTKIPLDMLFIDENNKIVKIETNTTPKSLDLINSTHPVTTVLEINGGLSNKFNIKVGNTVRFPDIAM